MEDHKEAILGEQTIELGRVSSDDEIAGIQEIPSSYLLKREFLSKHSTFESFDELLKQGGFTVESPEDFQALLGNDFDAYIASATTFKTWDSMIETASKDYFENKLGL